MVFLDFWVPRGGPKIKGGGMSDAPSGGLGKVQSVSKSAEKVLVFVGWSDLVMLWAVSGGKIGRMNPPLRRMC